MDSLSKHSVLQKRSQLLQQLRAFFYDRHVIEVDTPMLSRGAVPDPHLQSLQAEVQVPGEGRQTFYLHTSPEYPMKRLLCQDVGDMFYLGKVFRDGDLSPRHQIEFMMLEWYRLGFSMNELIDEVVLLLQQTLASHPQEALLVEKLTYRQAFHHYAGVDDILRASAKQCQDALYAHNVPEIVGVEDEDKMLWEQLLLTEVIEPQLGLRDGKLAITVIYHFPAQQAALAQVSAEDGEVAERFELFVNGMELANGYHELAEASLYQQRFKQSLAERQHLGFAEVPLDQRLLTALEENPLPDCSGVALGVDRLFALQQGFDSIEQGIGFGLLES